MNKGRLEITNKLKSRTNKEQEICALSQSRGCTHGYLALRLCDKSNKLWFLFWVFSRSGQNESQNESCWELKLSLSAPIFIRIEGSSNSPPRGAHRLAWPQTLMHSLSLFDSQTWLSKSLNSRPNSFARPIAEFEYCMSFWANLAAEQRMQLQHLKPERNNCWSWKGEICCR